MYCLYGIRGIGNGGSSPDMPWDAKNNDNNMTSL